MSVVLRARLLTNCIFQCIRSLGIEMGHLAPIWLRLVCKFQTKKDVERVNLLGGPQKNMCFWMYTES